VREEIERMEHKIRNLWNIRYRVTGSSWHSSSEISNQQPTTTKIYHFEYLQKMSVQIEPTHQKQNNIQRAKR
jgi:hypothetical protein